MLIDFKWNTYTKYFFYLKFIVYITFVIFYYMDIESGLMHMKLNKSRFDHLSFIATKGITMVIMLLFLIYAIIQFKIEKFDYFSDGWNYLELMGISIFYLGAYIDSEQ